MGRVARRVPGLPVSIRCLLASTAERTGSLSQESPGVSIRCLLASTAEHVFLFPHEFVWGFQFAVS